ncbi:MAG: hypothetical protein WCZ23_15325 [Rhodospirillaceae bacterium]
MAVRPRRRAVRGDDLRAALASRLPGRLRDLLAEYDTFAQAPAPDDAKGYVAHHAACKAALQHADMLIKLLRWAEGSEPDAPVAEADEMGRLLARARQAVEEEEGEEDDHDGS